MILSKPMEQDRQLYEIACLISPVYSEEEAQAFQQSLKNEVQNLGGFIDPAAGGDGDVIKRWLSHPVKKMTEAYLGSFRFLLSAEKISELKSKLNVPQVLRFILVHTKPQPARAYRPRPARLPARQLAGGPDGQEPITAQGGAVSARKTVIAPQTNEPASPKQMPPGQAAADIEEIDKRLEEILGK